MIKKVKIEDAIDQPLLHDLTAIMEDGFKGVAFQRGHIIEEKDLDKLRDMGKDHVFVGELEEGQIHEVDAILALDGKLSKENISYTGVKEGKIGLKSEVDGVFTINRAGLLKLNERGIYTFATKKSYTSVKTGDNLVGARIVPLFTDKKEVDHIVNVAKEFYPVFDVKPFKKLKVGVIITGSEIYYNRIKDLFEPIVRKKLDKFDCEIAGIEKCPDDLSFMEKTVQTLLDKKCDLIIFSGGMSVDPDDLTPSLIREFSDNFITQGVPVQPGNMLTVGKNKNTYLVGVPGASIHSDFTSFDIILPRIFAGIDLKKEDFTELGEDGLL